MKYLKIIVATSIIIIPFLSIQAQIKLSEGFESGSLPSGWTEENLLGGEPWRYRNGGHSPNDNNWLVPPDQTDIMRNPPSAYEGTYNAIFFKQGDGNERTKLVTPVMVLLGSSSVELSFYLCQIPWIFEGSGNNDALRVYYKVAQDSPWVLLQEYLDPVYDWDLQSLVLPNPSDDYYVAFEGHTRWGFGTCIDNVVIEDKGTTPLWIKELEFNQPVNEYTPSGISNLTLMRMDFKVFGNTDTAWLENVQFTSLNTSDSDIQSGGVKLYSTLNQTFSADNPLSTPTDFSSGVASFTGLHYSIPRGQSYVWLALDVDPNAIHENILDVKLAANSILANDTLYPANEVSPVGDITIYETRYSENFEGTHNWDLTGEFQVGSPEGLGGTPGNPDPTEAFSGSKVLGTDLSGMGDNHYKYEPSLDEGSSFKATSPSMDVLYYKNLNLFFQRHLNIEVWDGASIKVSTDGGSTWNTVWINTGYINDFRWGKEILSIPDQYARTDQLKVRFQLGPTNEDNHYSGWNIDDVYLTGEFIDKDVGVSRWVYPLSGSGHSASDSVTVVVRNYGGAEITVPVPVGYSFDGGISWVIDNITDNIPIGDSVTFTFPTKVDLSIPGLRPLVIAKTMLPGDQFTANDSVTTQVYIVPTLDPPHEEDFESNDGYWRTAGNDLWEYGAPGGNVIDHASSGSKSWVIGLTQQYDDLISQNKTIFSDDFETDKGWTFAGEFERDIPSNLHPPYAAFISPVKCIGTDLTEHGDSLYKYENGITTGTAYTATSPAFDVSNYTNLSINYFSYINVQAGDSVKLEVSPDNGSNWYELWKNSGEIMDVFFQLQDISLHDSLSSSTALRFRFSLFHSSASGPVSYGINIDNFSFFGDLISTSPANLTSPSYDLTGIDKPMFEARLWKDTEAGIDGATLLYSLDDGDTWTTISNSSGFDSYWNWYTGSSVNSLGVDGWSGQSGGWMTIRHLLPPAVVNQKNVQFMLKFAADKVNNNYDGVALDDVRIMEAPGDVGVTTILAPVSDCELGPSETFTLRFENFGIRDLQSGDSIKVGYHIDRSGEIQTTQEILILTQAFPVGGTLDIAMQTDLDFGKAGDYQVDVFTIEEDPYLYGVVANDSISQVIQVMKPAVDLGPDIYTVLPDTVVLNAYSGVIGEDYLWQDGTTTDSVFEVNIEGIYSVRVENSLGCIAKDTIQIVKLVADAGVTAIMAPISSCELGAEVYPAIIITNFGTDTLIIGYEIPARYQVDGGTVVEETFYMTEKVEPDSSFTYTFATSVDLSAVKTYSFKAYTSLIYDETYNNDTLSTSFDVFGYTSIDLGPDTLVREYQYTIDPGSGYDSYLWQDGSTNQTLLIDTTGTYRVTVTEGSKCANSDSVVITIVVPDIALNNLSNPFDACGLSSSEKLEFYVVNSGTDTLLTSDTIPVSYQINSGSQVSDTLFVYSKTFPGDSILFSSAQTIDLSNSGIYQFSVQADYINDLVPGNNSLVQSVEIFGYPNVTLGGDRVVNALTYTLDAGAGFISYLWHDGSTDQQFIIEYDERSPDSLYSVTVSDDNGCESLDEILVTFDIWDVTVESIISPTSACKLTDEEVLRVLVLNSGTRTIVNEQLKIIVSVDKGIPVTGQKTLTLPLEPGDSLEFVFGNKFDFSGEGDHTLTAYSIYAKDADPNNDTLSVIITHVGSPVIDLGGTDDSLGTTLPHTLDAGADFVVYLWNGISGNRTYNADRFGWHSLEVTDLLGCTGKDSVYLMLSTGLADIRLPGELKVYPIPSDNILHIEYRSDKVDQLYLEIFDSRGAKILIKEYRQTDQIMESLDVREMTQGIYYLKLRSDKKQIVKRIVIE
ncbi:MAG TPA: T9SS type A sorting domain-containing protein [Bacteroides sp.]|nr:T9SS type A sorting domain-containing protein [Bacteroides sp.]